MIRKSYPLSSRRGLVAGAALVVAAGLGFAAAKLTTPKSAPPEASAEAEKPASAALQLDTSRIAASGVKVEPVSVGGLASEIMAQATVAAEPGGQAVLTARAAGAISRITKRLGDPVRAGEVLALVESREASQIAAARSTAAAKAELARKVYARERRLYEQKVSPRQDMETAQAELASAEAEARAANAAVGAADVSRDGRYVMVVSPIGGRITATTASLGAFVQPETELFRVADPAKIQVEAAVTAADAQRVQPGDAAVVETGSGGTRVAVVRSVTPSLSPETRSATVVLALKSGGGGALTPGQTVRARISAQRTTSGGIIVPEEAAQTVEGRDAVFVRTPKGFRVQPVTLGARSGGRVQVLAGLKPGDAVATRNAFLLKAELGKGAEDEE
ncbi:efflux RND transporter periplasmic adaptor subunit [Phenylobacterium soli]|uniref:Efflux RND transporter periplasmic adaptor subunit n=1 Tax=Phenylobacterium soli TaxID=2170551 RepID=A0A328APZ8_9CAUL|nr:efflux RND transporter periplasmic adaptor subunit [Phenylobacterium soli]RAK54948.1 efflux RND transporter periplasmic adaptor subunit [Phenylobacterium soli]